VEVQSQGKERVMDRDVDKAKKSTAAKKMPIDKGPEKPQASSEDKKTKRGWSDVLDNITYSSGPGDNIYVFG
jgi:hypothetical protein